MNVYLVDRRCFTHSKEANAYRKSLGLKPAATFKIVIRNRQDLADLLNLLLTPKAERPVRELSAEETRQSDNPPDLAEIPPDSQIVAFLRKSWRGV